MGLPDIYDNIFDYSKTYINNNSEYSPKVLKSQPTTNKYFPIVIITEIDNPLYDETLSKTEQKYNVFYEIEIYTTNKGSIAKETIAEELKILVNNVFDNYYGFSRTSCRPTPNIDLNVFRYTLQFRGIVDSNKKINRGN